MQLAPREYFTIFRALDDHTDDTTYFMRAVIRNARTSELIATVNLTKQGDRQEYKKEWQVPADTSGLGFYITIVTSVYTDDTYTTKSNNWGDEGQTLLIDQRRKPAGGGGVDVNYDKIKRIFEEAVKAIKAHDDSQVLANLVKTRDSIFKKLEDMVESIDIPEATDPVPAIKQAIGKATEDISEKISNIKIKEPEKPDFSQINASIDELIGSLSEVKEDLKEIKDSKKLIELQNKLAEIVATHADALNQNIDELKPPKPKPKRKHML